MLSKNDACLLGVLELRDTWLILWLFVDTVSNSWNQLSEWIITWGTALERAFCRILIFHQFLY